MCFAILRVKFKNGDGDQTIDVENESDVSERVAALQNAPGVRAVRVFQSVRHIERVEQWVES